MSDLRHFSKVVEDLENETSTKYLRRAKYQTTVALRMAQSCDNRERADLIRTAIAALEDAIDPGLSEEQLRDLMEAEPNA